MITCQWMEFCVAWHKNRNRFLHKIAFRMRKWYSGTVVIPSRFIFNYIWHLKILWHHETETFIGFVNYSIYIFLCFLKTFQSWSALLIYPPLLARSQLRPVREVIKANVVFTAIPSQALVFFCYYNHYLTGLFACLFS